MPALGYEWLRKSPDHHDVQGSDVLLAGRNFAVPNVLGNPLTTVESDAFVPFGTPTEPGQRIPRTNKASAPKRVPFYPIQRPLLGVAMAAATALIVRNSPAAAHKTLMPSRERASRSAPARVLGEEAV